MPLVLGALAAYGAYKVTKGVGTYVAKKAIKSCVHDITQQASYELGIQLDPKQREKNAKDEAKYYKDQNKKYAKEAKSYNKVDNNILQVFADHLQGVGLSQTAVGNIKSMLKQYNSSDPIKKRQLYEGIETLITATMAFEKQLPTRFLEKEISQKEFILAKKQISEIMGACLATYENVVFVAPAATKGGRAQVMPSKNLFDPENPKDTPPLMDMLNLAQANDCINCFQAILEYSQKIKKLDLSEVKDNYGVSVMGNVLVNSDHNIHDDKIIPFMAALSKAGARITVNDLEFLQENEKDLNKLHNSENYLLELNQFGLKLEEQHGIEVLTSSAKMVKGLHEFKEQAKKDFSSFMEEVESFFTLPTADVKTQGSELDKEKSKEKRVTSTAVDSAKDPSAREQLSQKVKVVSPQYTEKKALSRTAKMSQSRHAAEMASKKSNTPKSDVEKRQQKSRSQKL